MTQPPSDALRDRQPRPKRRAQTRDAFARGGSARARCRPRVIALSWHHPRYGYRCIRALLAREGWQVRRKQVQRIRRREGLKVREKPKKIPRRGISTGLPTQTTHRHHVWIWDFIFDRTDNGGTVKMMALLDEYSRPSLAIQVERQITGAEVLRAVEQAMIHYGVPGYIRSDHGPEFIATTV